MRLRMHQRHSKQVTATLFKRAAVCGLLAFAGHTAGDKSASTIEAVPVAVASPTEFQDAVRSGVKHIIINEHLDMTTTPRFSETTIADTAVIAIVPNANNGYASTIRGNCSGPPPFLNPDPPVNADSGQCVITVREDFLELHIQQSQLWIGNLYVATPGLGKKNHTTLIGVHGGDVYLTDMTFVADRDKARAIDVNENSRVYVGRSHFSKFSKDKDGVIRLQPGARATIIQTSFFDNEVATGDADVVAAGPVMGLYAGPGKRGAAAWFQDCQFDGSVAAVPGEVAVEDRSCHVFSNTVQPSVWDLQLSREVSAWPLETPGVADGGQGRADVFAEVEAASGSEFLRPRDEFLQRILLEESARTGLDPITIEDLPQGTEFVTRDPYATLSDDEGHRFWTRTTTGLIAGFSIGGVLAVLAVLLAGRSLCLRRRHKNTDGGAGKRDKETYYTPPGSSIISASFLHALASNSHWATEVDTTCMCTMYETDMPLPDPTAPAARKLDFLHAQLNGIPKETVILERFTLLGPNQRRQGGQGIVAFAQGVHNDLGYAFKFFVDRGSFIAERDMYRSQTLGLLLPQVHAEYDPAETPTALLDRLGRPLPPCIVMERGESLPDWSKRAKPDIFQSVAVLAHVATRLRDMHAAGYVHRDIKPENVMFLHRENRWTVIDFGCAARSGEVAPLAYTLVYAPPEVAEAVDAGARTIEVTPAMDAWSLGVVAFELLTGQSAFKLVLEGRDSVVAKLLGREELPWEGNLAVKNPTARRRLGLFREPILSLLHRDPLRRASLADFCKTTNTVFSSPTTVEIP